MKRDSWRKRKYYNIITKDIERYNRYQHRFELYSLLPFTIVTATESALSTLSFYKVQVHNITVQTLVGRSAGSAFFF